MGKRRRSRSAIALATSVFWLVTSAPPAHAVGASCIYDGIETVTVLIEADTYAALELARSEADEVSVLERTTVDESWVLVPLTCAGGDGADPATTVVIESPGDYYVELTVRAANWTAGTRISVLGLDDYYVELAGSDGDDTIHTSELGLEMSPPPQWVWITGLEGDDDLELGTLGGAAVLGGGIYGGSGDDVLVSTVENAYLYGDDGDDRIKGASSGAWAANFEGGAGDDTITGGEGDDWLLGGPGDDVLDGGGGADRIAGEDGDDTVFGGPGDDWVDGDVLDWYGDAGGQPGNDRLDGGDGDDYLLGWAGDDVIDGGAGNDGVDGGDGADALSGGDGGDWLDGGSGDDVLDGGVGDDSLYGGDGRDALAGGEGNDGLGGGEGDDVLHGGPGEDGLFDGYRVRSEPPGYDELFGEEGDDLLFTGGTVAARLDGGADADACGGYSGGPSGTGRYVKVEYVDCERAEMYWAGCTYSPLDGGAVEVEVHGPGAVLSLARDPAGGVSVRVSEYEYRRNGSYGITDGTQLSCAGGGGVNVATSVVVDGAGSGATTDVFVHLANWTPETSIAIHDPDGLELDDWDVLHLIGTDAAETIDPANLGFALTGDAISSLEVSGEGGDDHLIGGIPAGVGGLAEGFVAYDGGDGDDVLTGGPGYQGLFGGYGDDVLTGGPGYQDLSGGDGDDSIDGGDDPDYLDGGRGNDTLHGGEGDDYLVGGTGDDHLFGEAGDDDLNYWGVSYRASFASGGADVLDGGDGEDHCDGYAEAPTGVRLYSRVAYAACELRDWGGG